MVKGRPLVEPAVVEQTGVYRTRTLLADGRELFYFDESPRPDRAAERDLRPLEPAHPSSSIRYDPLLDEWVAIAGHRQSRTYLPPDDECPLDPSTDEHLSEIPAHDYDVVVFQNRFPSFAETSSLDPDEESGALFASRPGLGRTEVVCFTSDHDAAFSSLPRSRVRTVVEAWVDRTRDLSALPDVAEVFCFENRGEEIGVTLSHPHGQIYGYPFVTPRTKAMITAARTYREHTQRNLFADVLIAEVASGQRIVSRSAYWTAFVPFAARWPLEVHIYPNRQLADLTELSAAERDAFCDVYLDVLRRMEAVANDTLPYISGWHQAPVREDRDLGYLHVEVFSIRRAPGKLKYLAGSESAKGAFINDVLPEDAAQRLRDVQP
jgi:UDPglucose--hexose-1-phosphate uridylyltransferase